MKQRIIPERVRRNVEVMGQQAWLDALPERVAALEREWNITVGETTTNGTEAFVALAETADGAPCAVKMVIPGIDPNRQQIRVLRAANGRGYVKLLRANEAENILLLERLGPQLHVSGLSTDEMLTAICATLREAWMPPPPGPAFISAADKAREMREAIVSRWEKYGRPAPERVFARGMESAERRAAAFDPATAVLVHGDAHEWNTLSAPGSSTGYKFVDPDGAFAERAFDLGVPMREWSADVLKSDDRVGLARHRCALLSRLTGVEQQPIWEWSLLQLLWNGMLLLDVDAKESATIEFAMAEAVAAAV